MREIKFRAWDIEKKKMLTVLSMEFTPLSDNPFRITAGLVDGNAVVSRPLINLLDREPEFILEEKIGRKDKNGVEIYEGDRVTGKWQVDKRTKRIGAVEYYSKYALYALTNQQGDMISICWKDCEVIGNIHEAPGKNIKVICDICHKEYTTAEDSNNVGCPNCNIHEDKK